MHMPLTHTSTFRVRYYECDGYGHVTNSNYLRYMQEAAFDASEAAGFGKNRYFDQGRVWIIRETDIDYLQSATYGETIEVKTWVADFSKVRSRRAYEMRNAESGEMVAKAMTDWAYLDLNTMRPAAITEDMVAAYWPDERPEPIPPRKKHPAPPMPPPDVFTIKQVVRWRDIDPMNHVNNAAYVAYMDNAAFEVARVLGWPVDRCIREGLGVLVRNSHIEYLQSAVMDDELEVSTWLSEVRRVSAIRHYTIRRTSDQALILQAHSRLAFVNLNTGRPTAMPDEFISSFAPNISGYTPDD